MTRLLILALCLPACSKKPVDREAAVRATVAAIEKAVEERDMDAVFAHLTDDFRGRKGQDAGKIRQMLQFQFIRQRSIHALVRVRELGFPAEGKARAELLVAVAGTPLPEDSVLDGLRADMFKVDLDLRRDDDAWKVYSADWSRAGADDLLD